MHHLETHCTTITYIYPYLEVELLVAQRPIVEVMEQLKLKLKLHNMYVKTR